MPDGKKIGLILTAIFYAAIGLFLVIGAKVGFQIYQNWPEYAASQGTAAATLEDPINRYDPLLGWKHIPGISVPMDGTFPGEDIIFEINASGFRGSQDYPFEKLPGKYRIIATGDSFTFGNTKTSETWPAFLEKQNPDYQVINMGASGYGIDQMYLWVREDGLAFHPDVVICAVIQDDFWRSLSDKWGSGYGKPLFKIRGGKLRLTNVPAPKRISPGRKNIRFRDFFYFVKQNFLKTFHKRNKQTVKHVPFQILQEFHQLVTDKNQRFLLVYLPLQNELVSEIAFSEELKTFCQKQKIEYLDLTGFLRGRLEENAGIIFRKGGHYNSLGNRYIAEGIQEYLMRTARE